MQLCASLNSGIFLLEVVLYLQCQNGHFIFGFPDATIRIKKKLKKLLMVLEKWISLLVLSTWTPDVG